MLTEDQNWLIIYDKFSPATERQRESLCALGNGFFCTRGAAPEARDDGVHYPGTYLAGGYNKVQLQGAGREFEQEQLVNLPNWLAVGFKINGGDWFSLKTEQILKYEQKLNLREGILYRTFKFRDAEARETTVSQRSFVHMKHSHLAALELTWMAHNWSGNITVRSALDGQIVNNSTQMLQAENERHLEYLQGSVSGDISQLKVITRQSRLVVALAARNFFFFNDRLLDSKKTEIIEPGYVAQELTAEIAQDRPLKLQKTVALYTSRDRGISEPGESAKNAVLEATDFASLAADQIKSWHYLWSQFDLFVDTTDSPSPVAPALLLHLSAFHTLQTASPNSIDLDVGLPARGWTGEGYQGHVFWDALFVFPFITFRMPAISASLLKYRYRRLSAARTLAKSAGALGARFPWQSGGDGSEDTPTFDWNSEKNIWTPENSAMQIHVNASIAYNIWQYYQVTADLDFMNEYGAEMLFEIARFFATYAKFDAAKRRYVILGVVGPDEFHTKNPGAAEYGIDNNAYTNIMAVWTLTSALELVHLLPADHRDRLLGCLKISQAEIDSWDTISRNMFIPFMDDGVIISQFEGFEKLSEFPSKNGGLDSEELIRVLQRENGTANQYQVCKQADVLLLFYVFSANELKELFHRLGYKFSCENIRPNIEYYLPKTANGSTLSRLAHVWVLSRLDRLNSWKLLASPNAGKAILSTDEPHSWPVLLEALSSDFGDIHHDSAREGIHMGAMGGTLDIVQRCYTGLVVRQDVLFLNPRLPSELTILSFGLHYRGQALQFEITQERMTVTALHSTARTIKIGFENHVYNFDAGDTKVFNLHAAELPAKVV